MKSRLVLLLAALALATSPWLMRAASATPSHYSHTQAVSFTFDLDVTIDCHNSPGNTVHINGPIGIGGSSASVWYQNNTKGTHQTGVYSGVVEASIDPVGGSVDLVKQPSLGGSGGNPWIWYDAGDGLGPQLVGRCVGSHSVGKHFGGNRQVTVDLLESLQALDCSKTNAAVHLKHQQQNPEVNGMLYFDNNVNKPTHPSQHAATMTVALGTGMTLDKETDVKAGMGNPLVYLFPGDSGGADAATLMKNSKTVNVGRCNQLL